MKVLANTYSDMTLVIDGHILENGVVVRSSVSTPIKFDGINTISRIYDERFKQREGDTITFTVGGIPLVFDYDHGMELWDIADKLFWEYQELANPEIAKLMAEERLSQIG